MSGPRILLLFLAPLFFPACATMTATGVLREQSAPTREIVDRPFVAGSFLGEEQRDGAPVRVFEFPDALVGDPPRALRVRVPVRRGGGPCEMEEFAPPAGAAAGGRHDAVLFRDVHWDGEGLPFDPGGADFRETPQTFFVGVGPFAYDKPGGEHDYGFTAGTRDEYRSGNAWRGVCDRVDVAWVARSRARWLSSHAVYPFALVADVVTAPLQFLAFGVGL